MLWVAMNEGLVSVQQDPSPRETHPVRVVTVTTIAGGERLGPRESAYESVDEANAALSYEERESEDIELVMVEGCLATSGSGRWRISIWP